MHVIFRESHGLDEADSPRDLAQAPAELVVLSFSDSDLGAFAAGWHRGGGRDAMPSLRLANLSALTHPLSVDTYVERTLEGATGILVRLIGGAPYWSYGLDQVERPGARPRHRPRRPARRRPPRRAARRRLDPAGLHPPPPRPSLRHRRRRRRAGVAAAARPRLRPLRTPRRAARRPCPRSAPGRPSTASPVRSSPRPATAPRVLIPFYRSWLTAADTAPVAALIAAFRARGFDAIGLFAPSLKAPEAALWLARQVAPPGPRRHRQRHLLLGARGGRRLAPRRRRRAGLPGRPLHRPPRRLGRGGARPLARRPRHARGPAGGRRPRPRRRRQLQGGERPRPRPAIRPHGAPPRAPTASPPSPTASPPGCASPRPRPRSAARPSSSPPIPAATGTWPTPSASTRPPRPRRSSTTSPPPATTSPRPATSPLPSPRGRRAGPSPSTAPPSPACPAASATTSTPPGARPGTIRPSRRGASASPPCPAAAPSSPSSPSAAIARAGASEYHDLSRTPRHAYVAFYLWLRARADALVHVGAHGTLEWLPGKAVALSETCWPEALAGDLPVIYPFIVNDPGEAAQAKRRIGAVAIGHVPPPLKPSGTPERLAPLEALLDEFSTADGLDPKRRDRLVADIRDEAQALGVEDDLGLAAASCPAEADHPHRPLRLRREGGPVRRRAPCLGPRLRLRRRRG